MKGGCNGTAGFSSPLSCFPRVCPIIRILMIGSRWLESFCIQATLSPASGHVWLIQELVCEICAWFLALLLHLWGWSLGDIECIVGIDDDWNCLRGPLAKKINYIYGTKNNMLNIMCDNSQQQTCSILFAKKALFQHTLDLVLDRCYPSSSYCESCYPATVLDLSIGVEGMAQCKCLCPTKHSHSALLSSMRPKFPLPPLQGGWCSWTPTRWCNGSTPHHHDLLSSQWHLSTPESL